MPDLDFRVETAEPVPFAVAPLLHFKLRIDQAAESGSGSEVEVEPIHAVALRRQIRIEPARRRYAGREPERLSDLFDRPERWGQTLRPMLWTHTSVVVPPFTTGIVVDLPVPCTFDFNVAVTKYLDVLDDGEVPLCLLFSGTIFHEDGERGLQVAQISWEKEASYRLPVRVWKDMMNLYYPNTAWLCLRKDVFDRLNDDKRRRGLPTWEQELEALLPERNGRESS